MKYDYKEKDIEVFSNLLKANLVRLGEFRLVEGADITYWYNCDQYYELKGTLGNSCMKYSEKSDYFEVYEDHAKMLCWIRNNKLMGRALVWEIDGNTYMDRIYTCDDYLYDTFIQYAKDNRWYFRANSGLLSSGNDQWWLDPNSNYTEEVKPNLIIKLDNYYSYMPYMDSFRYYNKRDNSISTVTNDYTHTLDNTEGTYGDEYPWECDCCGHIYYSDDEDTSPDDLYWSEYDDQYLCNDCRQYCSGLDQYINHNHTLINVYTPNGIKNYPKDLLIDDEVNEACYIGNGWYFCKVNDEWYTTNYPDLCNDGENGITLKSLKPSNE